MELQAQDNKHQCDTGSRVVLRAMGLAKRSMLVATGDEDACSIMYEVRVGVKFREKLMSN